MRNTSTSVFARLALLTMRLRLFRLSEYCAAKAGHFDGGASTNVHHDLRFMSLAKWLISNSTATVEERLYLMGYSGHLPSRTLRRIFAGTKAHRAWLSGIMGVYKDEHGQQYGVCDRMWTIARVLPQDKNTTSALTTLGHAFIPWRLPCRPHQRHIPDTWQSIEIDDIPW